MSPGYALLHLQFNLCPDYGRLNERNRRQCKVFHLDFPKIFALNNSAEIVSFPQSIEAKEDEIKLHIWISFRFLVLMFSLVFL